MKGSSATSGAPTGPATATPTGDRPSASSPTPFADAPQGGYPLAGPSQHPDPRVHAYRQDLADVALAGTVIASHYAEPLSRRLTTPAALLVAPDDSSEILAQLSPGTEMRVLDDSRGWAWGYAEGQVGYVPSLALAS